MPHGRGRPLSIGGATRLALIKLIVIVIVETVLNTRHPLALLRRMPSSYMTPWAMSGNGHALSMKIDTTVKKILAKIKPKLKRVAKIKAISSCAAAPGASTLGGRGRRTATGGSRLGAAGSADFGSPGSPNPWILALLPLGFWFLGFWGFWGWVFGFWVILVQLIEK